jgi:hypothetical protein
MMAARREIPEGLVNPGWMTDQGYQWWQNSGRAIAKHSRPEEALANLLERAQNLAEGAAKEYDTDPDVSGSHSSPIRRAVREGRAPLVSGRIRFCATAPGAWMPIALST